MYNTTTNIDLFLTSSATFPRLVRKCVSAMKLTSTLMKIELHVPPRWFSFFSLLFKRICPTAAAPMGELSVRKKVMLWKKYFTYQENQHSIPSFSDDWSSKNSASVHSCIQVRSRDHHQDSNQPEWEQLIESNIESYHLRKSKHWWIVWEFFFRIPERGGYSHFPAQIKVEDWCLLI